MSDHEYIHWADARPVEQVPGLTRRVIGYTDKMMICEFRAQAGAVVPLHSHPHEQVGYVVSGTVEVTINGALHTCNAGDGYSVPGDVKHGSTFSVDTIFVECFSPPREEYRA
jgi:unsaturated pyranuronate lyase